MLVRLLLLVFLVVPLTSLIQYGYSSQATSFVPNLPVLKDPLLKTEVVFHGLPIATTMAFLGPNDILVLDKNNGTVQRIVNGVIQKEPLLDVNVANNRDRGMLGIAISNSTPGHTYLYLYYTEAATRDGEDSIDDSHPLGNRLYRYELIDNKLVNPRLLLDLPTRPGTFHNGGFVIIGPDNNIYTAIGDLYGQGTNYSSKAQNYVNGVEPDGRGGILRITQEGEIVADGILGNTYPMNLYYSYGIRNSFGIDFDPVTGNLWDTENGPEYGDEINIVGPGCNSGWIKIQGIWVQTSEGIKQQYNDLDGLVDFDGKGKYCPPEFSWKNSVGVTSIKFLTSDKYGQYENDLFVADSRGRLYHFALIENRTQLQLLGNLSDKVANTEGELQEVIFGEGFGVITDLEVGSDGYLYILTLAGTIFRVIPTIDESIDLTQQDYVWKPAGGQAKILHQSGNLTVYVNIDAADKMYNRGALETQINSTRLPSILSLDLNYSSKSVGESAIFSAEIRDIQNMEENQSSIIWSRTLNNTDGKVIKETFNLPNNITNKPLELRMYVISDGPGEHILNIKNASLISSYEK